MFLRSWFKKTQPVKSNLSLAIDNLSSIELKNIYLVYSSDASTYMLKSFCDRIQDYITLLEFIITYFQERRLIYVHQIPQALKTIYLNSFYLDSQGKFIDTQEVTSRFMGLSIEFIELYTQAEQGERNFEIDKNLLLTQQIIQNIISISSDLIKIDQEL
jgi:hypothetical protein